MTDEEISELAECLEDACRSFPLGAIGQGINKRCPFGALRGGPYHPEPDWVGMLIPVSDARSFMRGFDGFRFLPRLDRRLFNLGRQFRERYP